MKQLTLSFLLALLPLLASADAVEIDGIWYNLIKKGKAAEVAPSQNGKYSGQVDILTPITYDGVSYNVTCIGEYAFASCGGLTSITIPKGVTSISNSAFSGCSGLTSVIIPNSVTSIGNSAFQNCSGLTSVTIPNSVTSIGNSAFSGCCGLTTIAIPNSVTSIGSYTFSGCSGLTSITIPNSVTSIGSDAFSGCSLRSVNISDIAAWCNINFGGNTGNPLVYAHHLLYDGNEITNLVIPNGVKYIGWHAFEGCSGLTSVIIPNSVTSIGNEAFCWCSGLTSVTIGNSVTNIGLYAFQNCIGLTSVTIPNSVTDIGYQAFQNCSGLTSVTIGNSVINIDRYAFDGCSGLTSVTIPNSVKRIYSQAFANCGDLTDVYCLAEKIGYEGISTSDDAFDGSYSQYITLHVPAASIEAYRSTMPWSNFGSIVALESSDIPEPPTVEKCATPTISFENGKIKFSCETEGVEYISEITTTDTKKYYHGELSPTFKYTVSVYATKSGYENSNTTTMEITASGKLGDLDGNGIVNVADHVELSKIIMDTK